MTSKRKQPSWANSGPKWSYGKLEHEVEYGGITPKEAIYHGANLLGHYGPLTGLGFYDFAVFFRRMIPLVDWSDPKTVFTGEGLYWSSVDDALAYVDHRTGGLLNLVVWFKDHLHDPEAEFVAAIDAKVQNLLAKADAQTTEGGEEEVRPGAPVGNKNAAKQEDETNHNNVMNCSDDKKATTQGNSTDYTLRRITKAAKGIKSGGTKPTPELQAKCSTLLEKIASKEVTVNQAAIEAGFRKPQKPKPKPTTPLELLDYATEILKTDSRLATLFEQANALPESEYRAFMRWVRTENSKTA